MECATWLRRDALLASQGSSREVIHGPTAPPRAFYDSHMPQASSSRESVGMPTTSFWARRSLRRTVRVPTRQPKQASICKRRGRSVEVSHGTNLDDAEALRPWVSSGFVLASIDTDLRVFGQRRDIESLTGSGVTYAGGHVVLRHCFAASAQPLTAAGTLHRLLLPHPVITAGRLFQRARLRNNHGANSAYLSRWPS